MASRRPAGILLLAVLLSVAGVLTACGGDSASGDPNSANYDPAKTTLHDAGLEVCNEDQQQNASTLASGPGVTAVRSFTVAKDCNGRKDTPDEITVVQFDSREAVDAGEKAIETAYPNASTLKRGPLVIVATGPASEENLAAIDDALGSSTTTTS